MPVSGEGLAEAAFEGWNLLELEGVGLIYLLGKSTRPILTFHDFRPPAWIKPKLELPSLLVRQSGNAAGLDRIMRG